MTANFANLNLDKDPVANLKSPRAEKNINWIDLVQDAVCLEDEDDDEEPFNPVAYSKTKPQVKKDFIYINNVEEINKGGSKQ